jgi:hypothetical protein
MSPSKIQRWSMARLRFMRIPPNCPSIPRCRSRRRPCHRTRRSRRLPVVGTHAISRTHIRIWRTNCQCSEIQREAGKKVRMYLHPDGVRSIRIGQFGVGLFSLIFLGLEDQRPLPLLPTTSSDSQRSVSQLPDEILCVPLKGLYMI